MAEAVQPGRTEEATDPRILRSRTMLMEGLARLLNRKDFDDISIQEIADEATLNRATFYLHYLFAGILLVHSIYLVSMPAGLRAGQHELCNKRNFSYHYRGLGNGAFFRRETVEGNDFFLSETQP